MIIFVGLINIFFIGLLAARARRHLAPGSSGTFWPALGLRLAAGISIGVFYLVTYNGKGDTFHFFNSATALSAYFYIDPSVYFEYFFSAESLDFIDADPRSLFFIKIVSVVNILTLNNYYITSMWFSLFSFICSFRLVAKLDLLFPSTTIASRIALLFVPSVVFWSSGLLKESLAFGAVQVLSLYFLSFMHDEKVTFKSGVEIVLSLVLLLSLKYYWAGVLLPSMITALVIRKIDPKKYVASWYLISFILLCVIVSFTHPNFYLSRFLSVIVDNNRTYVNDDLIRYYHLSPTWTSILVNSPVALFSGLFRPLFNFSSIPGVLASVENLVLFGLFIWKMKSIRFPAAENRLTLFAVLTYITVLCIFLALSTPNLGTLSRYRVGFLSFFVLLILADHPILNFINGKSSNHIRS